VTIFYCLRFETSLFVASYDSQGHGGGIRIRLHTGAAHGSTDSLKITTLHGSNRKHLSNNTPILVCLPICCLETGSSIVACMFISVRTCLPSPCLAMKFSGFQVSCHNIYFNIISHINLRLPLTPLFFPSCCVYGCVQHSAVSSSSTVCCKIIRRGWFIRLNYAQIREVNHFFTTYPKNRNILFLHTTTYVKIRIIFYPY
jgi:hypothetical protein